MIITSHFRKMVTIVRKSLGRFRFSKIREMCCLSAVSMILLSGCSWQSFKATFHPSVQDKRLAVRKTKSHWEKNRPFSFYGFARSQQLLETKGFEVSEAGGTFEGWSGMAALISADGYALTANHVVKGTLKLGVIETPDKTRRLHLITVNKKDAVDDETKPKIYFLPFPNPRRLTARERGEVSITTARVVHRFSGQDLALIKLPATKAPFFKIGEIPAPGDPVFASGNGISAAPFPTAGQVVKAPDGGDHFLARMPAAMGDSGGPVFDKEGQLVGLISKGTMEGAGSLKGLRWFQSSCCEVPNKAEIEKLISADRSRSR